VEANEQFLTTALWLACSAPPIDLAGREVYGGLDLSATSDLTALVLVHRDPLNGEWSAESTFWLPEEGLEANAKADRTPYDLWVRQGHLIAAPGASISYEYVARYLWAETFARHKVVKIAFDRWNFRYLKPWLLEAGFSEAAIAEKFVEFGQGTQSMSPALRALEEIVLNRKLRHGSHPVLNLCAANAVTEGSDPSNRKLSKKRARGRIDGMVALTMAIGVAPFADRRIEIAALIG
jgi:phage terminase large subunit-like protein